MAFFRAFALYMVLKGKVEAAKLISLVTEGLALQQRGMVLVPFTAY